MPVGVPAQPVVQLVGQAAAFVRRAQLAFRLVVPQAQGLPCLLYTSMGLALGAIGFGTIATFITLYYASRGWANAVLCLSAFGGCFIGARLLFANSINRLGGFRVAIICLGVESLGLLLLWRCV